MLVILIGKGAPGRKTGRPVCGKGCRCFSQESVLTDGKYAE